MFRTSGNNLKSINAVVITMSDPFQQWPGFSDSLTLIINVDKSEFGIQPGPVEFEGKPFKPKAETHVTVFGSATASVLLNRIELDPAVEGDLITAFENTDWSYTITGDYRHLVRAAAEDASADATEESIIVLLEMGGMARFYDKLKELALLDNDLPVPPPHVTLYTYHCDTGIGVPSNSELGRLTHQRIQRPA